MSSTDLLPVTTAGHEQTTTDWNAVATLLAASGPDGGLISRQFALKATTTSRASTTTMATDPDLTLPCQANGNYGGKIFLGYVSTAAGQIKIGFTVPSGASIIWCSNGLDSTVTASGSGITDQLWRAGSTPTLGVDGTTNTSCTIEFTVLMGSTAGNVNFQWAQAVSNATAAQVLAKSRMTLERYS